MQDDSIFAPAKRCKFELKNLLGHELKVITERADRSDWTGSGTWELELKVCGMFELTENGKIIEWCEYYDNEGRTKKGGPSLVL